MSTKENIIQAAMQAILQQGYDGMGLEDILKTANASKGSFYHFFQSKDNLVLEVIQRYESHYTAIRQELLTDSSLPAKRRIFNYLQFLVADQRQAALARGCLYGMLAQSANARSENVRAKLNQIFSVWREHLASALALAKAEGELICSLSPEDAADFVVCAYEGALIKYKVDHQPQGLQNFVTACMLSLFGSGE